MTDLLIVGCVFWTVFSWVAWFGVQWANRDT